MPHQWLEACSHYLDSQGKKIEAEAGSEIRVQHGRLVNILAGESCTITDMRHLSKKRIRTMVLWEDPNLLAGLVGGVRDGLAVLPKIAKVTVSNMRIGLRVKNLTQKNIVLNPSTVVAKACEVE